MTTEPGRADENGQARKGHAVTQYANPARLAEDLASIVAARLQTAIATRGEAFLAVSGGTTPVLFFQTLSRARLDWRKVTVCLVDERCVPADHPRSNERLVRDNLLQNEAAQAGFVPLYRVAENAGVAARSAEAAIAGLGSGFDVVVLGMGQDGHTASFFPGGDHLAHAMDAETTSHVLPMQAEGAGEPRLTLTLPIILAAELIILHIEGAAKREVLDLAMSDGPAAEMPIRAVLDRAGEKLSILWAP